MTTSLLENLISGAEETRTVLMKDSCQCNGRLLLKSVAVQCLQRFSSVHLFLFDMHPPLWLRGVPQHLAQRLALHDCCTDHLGWSGSTVSGPAPLHEATPSRFLQEVDRELGQATPTQEGSGAQTDCAIVIDSLSTLLDFHTTPYVCRLVHELGRQCGMVVCLLHSDLHDSHVTSQLSHVTSTSIEINPTPPSLQADYHCSAKVSHCKTTGKLLVSTELIVINDNFEVSSVTSDPRHAHWKGPEEVALDPTANLTFDLTLSERAKEERSRLVLPYHHSAEKRTALLQAGSGKIFYQPDEADDYDDSDPDDDLDI